jgi:anti-anti-sigma factor
MRMFGLAEDAGTDTPPTFTPDTRSAIQARLNECLAAGKTVTFEERLGLRDREVWTHAMYTPVPQGAGRPPWVVITSFDITEQKMREQEELNIREAIIQQQSMTLAELSTPLLTISNRVVVLPLVGTVDSRRAQQIMETLLEGIATRAALVAILDITGVAIVDTQVANALLQAAKAARLLGTQVILTGIRPEVAQTLVGLGVDLSGIVTRSTLQAGIAESLHY